MNEYKISVVVAVYKAEKYIEKCVKSILNQTHKNIELILVDDGSPDNSGKMCDELAQKDDRIKVIHQKNGGASAARNTGIDAATGDYITFVDSDDWIDEDMLEVMLSKMIEHDADVSRCGFAYDYGYKVDDFIPTDLAEITNKEDFIAETVRGGVFNGSLCNKIFKRETIGDLRLDVNIKYSEDGLLCYQISKRSSKCVYINKPFYHYRKDNETSANALGVGLDYYHILVEGIFKEQKKGTRAYNNALDWLQLAASAYLHNEIQNKPYSEVDFSTRKFLRKYLIKILSSKTITKYHKKRMILLFLSKKKYYDSYKKKYEQRMAEESKKK